MSLRARLILSFGSIIIIMLITSGLTIRNLTRMNAEIASIGSTWIPVATSIQSTYALLFSSRGDLSAITTLHDPKEIENYSAHMTGLLRRIGDSKKAFAAALENMPPSDRKQAIMDITAQIEAQSGQFVTMRKDLLAFIRAGKNEEAAQLLASSRGPFLRLADLYEQIVSLSNEGDGKYTFTMPAGKVEVKATFMEDNSMLNFFYDVPNNAYFYEAVKWAVKNGITTGVGNNLFAPEQPCTRAQIVTFLWRSQKSPAAGTANPFTDVKASAYYADAVLWAVKEDVTKGTTNTTFSPDANCTRAQIVTFIWRALAEYHSIL